MSFETNGKQNVSQRGASGESKERPGSKPTWENPWNYGISMGQTHS
jgi:hypothetical protein